MGAPGRAHHRLPRPGGPSPGAGRARPGAGALTRRIRAMPDGAMSALTWDQGSEIARHQRQGRCHRDRARSFAHPHSPWERGTNENTNRHRGPPPAQRHPITSHSLETQQNADTRAFGNTPPTIRSAIIYCTPSGQPLKSSKLRKETQCRMTKTPHQKACAYWSPNICLVQDQTEIGSTCPIT